MQNLSTIRLNSLPIIEINDMTFINQSINQPTNQEINQSIIINLFTGRHMQKEFKIPKLQQ